MITHMIFLTTLEVETVLMASKWAVILRIFTGFSGSLLVKIPLILRFFIPRELSTLVIVVTAPDGRTWVLILIPFSRLADIMALILLELPCLFINLLQLSSFRLLRGHGHGSMLNIKRLPYIDGFAFFWCVHPLIIHVENLRFRRKLFLISSPISCNPWLLLLRLWFGATITCGKFILRTHFRAMLSGRELSFHIKIEQIDEVHLEVVCVYNIAQKPYSRNNWSWQSPYLGKNIDDGINWARVLISILIRKKVIT